MTDKEPTAAVAARMSAGDQAARALGIIVERVEPGRARASMAVREDMLNGHRICHGGLIFTLADTACAYACNSYNEVTLAQRCTIDFLAPAKLDDRLLAVAEERTLRGRSGIYDVSISGQDSMSIALFRGNSRRIGGNVLKVFD